MEKVIATIKGIGTTLLAYLTSLFHPINDFYIVIAILATGNIVIGWLADTGGWSFKKAFTAIWYLVGYMGLLAVSLIVGKLMHLEDIQVVDFTSWVTWVMIYFYVANILRNWNTWQPNNKPIEFLYWVATFKILDKIKYMKDFNDYKKGKSDGKS